MSQVDAQGEQPAHGRWVCRSLGVRRTGPLGRGGKPVGFGTSWSSIRVPAGFLGM
jgi:hypothetical protein